MARNKYNIDEELDAPFNWPQFKRSLVYVKKYKKPIAIMFILAVVASILGLVIPRIQAYIIDSLIPQGHKVIGTIVVLGIGYFLINIGVIFINKKHFCLKTVMIFPVCKCKALDKKSVIKLLKIIYIPFGIDIRHS